MGCHDVRSYIQSGNVVFRSDKRAPGDLQKELSAAVLLRFGVEPAIIVLTAAEFRHAIERNPFSNRVEDGKSMHYFFLADDPTSIKEQALQDACADSESYAHVGKTFYLLTPEGFARSKLAANVERYLGVPATARNQRTVMRVAAMIE